MRIHAEYVLSLSISTATHALQSLVKVGEVVSMY